MGRAKAFALKKNTRSSMNRAEAKQAGVVRVGLIGYGYAGRTFHAPSILAVDGMTITAVGSGQGEALREIFPGSTICAAEEVPTREDVDLVVIATPNDSHYPLAKAALLAGKDVVIDKPFTVTLEEARSL